MNYPSDLTAILDPDIPTAREEEAKDLLNDFERALERAQEIESDLIDARVRVTSARNRVLERMGVRV